MESANLSSWIALTIGFLHALEPGHGKTALFTYLAAGKKTWREGLVIALSSALTHSAAVFVIAFISHYFLHHSTTEETIHKFSDYLSFLSGGIIFMLGVWVITKVGRGEDLHKNCCGHKKKVETNKSSLMASGLIGFATGIIPCPTVIVAYLSGVASGDSSLGIQSVGYFAFGMFLALICVVIAFNFGGQKIIERLKTKKISKFNWGYIQGGVFMLIGVFTAFFH